MTAFLAILLLYFNFANGENFEELYAVGKESYLSNDWSQCVKYMERALKDYKMYNSEVTKCKMKCRKLMAKEPNLFEKNIENLHFFEEAVRNTLCIMKCKRETFGPNRVEQVTAKVLKDFDEKLPYDYLQLCYFQERP